MNESRNRKLRILVTGAGGAAAIAFYKAIEHLTDVEVFMADMDPYSTGLYLVDKEYRCLLPHGQDEHYSVALLRHCEARNIDVVIPTVDCEMQPIARFKDEFDKAGVQLVMSPLPALDICVDKFSLMEKLQYTVELAPYGLFDQNFQHENWNFPFVIKPRSGSGSRNIHVVNSEADLKRIPRDGSYMAQELLPGAEYSVDVYVNRDNHVIASVIRERIKVDSGIAVISKTVIDKEISQLAAKIAQAVGIRYVANIQFKRDGSGEPKLLEINPRFPGTMSLTVAAGINMPEMCLQEMQNQPLADYYSYRPLAMVRNWQETFMSTSEFLLPTAA